MKEREERRRKKREIEREKKIVNKELKERMARRREKEKKGEKRKRRTRKKQRACVKRKIEIKYFSDLSICCIHSSDSFFSSSMSFLTIPLSLLPPSHSLILFPFLLSFFLPSQSLPLLYPLLSFFPFSSLPPTFPLSLSSSFPPAFSPPSLGNYPYQKGTILAPVSIARACNFSIISFTQMV